MGHEITLLIGRVEYKEKSLTNKKEIDVFFSVYATIDLCKCGDSYIDKINMTNKDHTKNYYCFYRNFNEPEYEDCYGTRLLPIPIKTITTAIHKDNIKDNYRRYKWALSILESMQDDVEELSVIIYRHQERKPK